MLHWSVSRLQGLVASAHDSRSEPGCGRPAASTPSFSESGAVPLLPPASHSVRTRAGGGG